MANRHPEELPTRKNADRLAVPKQKRRRGRRTLHHILLLTFVLIVGIALSLTVFFKIEEISVFGSDYYEPQAIIDASGIPLGTNLFLADTAGVPERLKAKFPYIEEVFVHRKLPPAIEIELLPSKPAAALQQGEEYALITSSGKILERGLILLPADILLVKGVELGSRQPGEYLGRYTAENVSESASEEVQDLIKAKNDAAKLQAENEKDALAVVSYMMGAIEKTSFGNISNLDLSDPLNMTVMYENRLLLRLGTELDLEYKLQYIQESIARLDPNAHGEIRAENTSKDGRVVYSPAEGYDMNGVFLAGVTESPETSGEELTEPSGISGSGSEAPQTDSAPQDLPATDDSGLTEPESETE